MLVGRRPYEGTTTSILAQILIKQPPRPSELRPDVPPKLEEICLKAIAKTPADRYASMTQFAAALAEYLRNPQQPATAAPAPKTTEAARPTPPPSATTAPIKGKIAPTAPASGRSSRSDVNVRPSGTGKSGVKSGARSGSKRNSGKRKKKQQSQLPLIIGVAALVLVGIGAVVAGIVFWPSSNKNSSSSLALTTGGNPNGPSPNFYHPNPNSSPTKPTTPTETKPTKPTTPGFTVTTDSDTVKLAVGMPTKVTITVDRQEYKGAVTVSWKAPTNVLIAPGGPVTLKPEQNNVELTLRVLAETALGDSRLDITATPKDEPQRAPVAASLGVAIPPGSCIRVVEIGNKPGGALEAMAFAPDASLVLIGGGAGRPQGQPEDKVMEGNAIQVWNLERVEAISALAGHRDRVTTLALTADGSGALWVSADETVATWDLRNGKLKKQTPKQAQHLLLAALSADGIRALLAYAPLTDKGQTIPGYVIRFAPGNFAPIGTQMFTAGRDMMNSRDAEAVRALAVAPDHKQALIGGITGKLVLIDMVKLDAKHKHLTGHDEAVLCAAFSPVDNCAASGGGGVLQVGKLQQGKDNAVRLWNLTSGTEEWKADGHTNSVVSLAFSADGSLLASGSSDGEVRVWRVKDGSPVATLPGHTAKVLGMAFTKDGKQLWTGAADRTLRQWRLP